MNDNKWHILGDWDGCMFAGDNLYWVTPVYIDANGNKQKDSAHASPLVGNPLLVLGEVVCPKYSKPRRTDTKESS